MFSDGITALTGQLIPGRQIQYHQTMYGVKLVHGVLDAIGRNKDQRPHGQLQLLTQANVAEAPSGAVLDEFTTYQVEGSVVDYLASDG